MRLIFIFLSVILIGCKKTDFKSEWTKEQAPEIFLAKFETTKGDFEVQVTRKLSPKAADRFYQLVKRGYFDNGIFYRVVPGFVAQFGNTDTAEMSNWKASEVEDEIVLSSNIRGTISFARFGKNSRDLEVFINLGDNTVLDTLDFEGVKGFPAFGNISNGMNVVDELYSGYAERTMEDPNLYSNRSAFYQRFPKLDLIKKAYIIE